jgi:hypothetical protein
MFLWCLLLLGGLDDAEVARRYLEKGVVLASGNAFCLSQSARGYMRSTSPSAAIPGFPCARASAIPALAIRPRRPPITEKAAPGGAAFPTNVSFR